MLHGAIWVLVLGVTGYIALALATFDNRDPSLFFLRNIPNTGVVYNKAGLAGAYLADLAYASLGLSAWWLVAGGLVWLFRHMRSQDEAHSKVLFGIGLAIILFFMPVVERLLWEDDLSFMLQDDAGGWVGKNTTDVFLMYLGRGGSLFVLGVVLVAGFKLMVQFSYRELGGELWKKIKEIRDYILERHSDNSEGDTIAPKAAEIKQPWLKRVSGSLKREKNTENVDKTDKPVAKSTEQSSDKPVEKKNKKSQNPQAA
nr:DNA translocase FtsK 4TM domain-containing protein [Alysiella crassa]UOP08188.1 DNA translocase FtsK 4TM domain-containing protein [Alysiella crassa]